MVCDILCGSGLLRDDSMGFLGNSSFWLFWDGSVGVLRYSVCFWGDSVEFV